MKKHIFLNPLFCLVLSATIFAQEKPVTFTVSVSSDSILMDNYFEVKFTVENAFGEDFSAPDFYENFDVVKGPISSNSTQVTNGKLKRRMTIVYYLKPKEVGAFYIQPASIVADGKVFETPPLEVFVHPNPAGAKQRPNIGHEDIFSPSGSPSDSTFSEIFKGFDEQGIPFSIGDFFKLFDTNGLDGLEQNFNGLLKQFDMDMSQEEMDEMFKQLQEQMPQFDFPLPGPPTDKQNPEQETAPKKKRKTTRI